MSGAVVIQTAWLGDVVLTTPLLRAVAARHGPVGVVTTPAAAPLLTTHPATARVYRYDKRGRDRGPAGLARLIANLRVAGYDTAYHPQSSWRSALLAWMAGIPTRIGFDDAPGRFLYTHRVPREGTHEAERLRSLGPTDAPSELSLRLTATDHADAQRLLARHGITPPFVALAPDSARATKRWPYYNALAEHLGRKMDVVFVGSTDRRIDGWAARRSSSRRAGTIPRSVDPWNRRSADLSGLPIRVSAAVIARAAVAVTNDSAPLHLAQAVGTPVVAIFGPTAPARFGPRGPRDTVVGVDLDCRPCSSHGGARCPLGHHLCLRDLSPQAVRAAVERVLTREEVPCG